MIAQVMERIVTQTIPRGGHRQPARRLGPVRQHGDGRRPSSDSDRPRAGRSRGRRRPRARHALRAAARHLPAPCAWPTRTRRPRRRSSRAASTRTARCPRRGSRRCSRQCSPRRWCRASAKLIEARLGRPLEPFDIWYNGFQPRGAYTEAQLDADHAQASYPTAAAFAADMPRILASSASRPSAARYLADQHRGRSGARRRPRHGARRGAATSAHLRTRVEHGRHELQGLQHRRPRAGPQRRADVLAERRRSHSLDGVPNTAFTEALAFVFQARDLELLGLAKPDATSRRARDAQRLLGDLRDRRRGAGRHATSGTGCTSIPRRRRRSCARRRWQIARDVWNQYYAPVFGRRDVVLLGDLLAHDRLRPLPARLPDRPPDRVPDRGADRERAGNARRRVRAHGARRAASRPTCG